MPGSAAASGAEARDEYRQCRTVFRNLVRLTEEEQKCDLLDVSHVDHAVVPEDVGEVPGFADDLLGVRARLRSLCKGVIFSPKLPSR